MQKLAFYMFWKREALSFLPGFTIKIFLFLSLFLLSLTPFVDFVNAEIATDGTTGPSTALSGPDFEIPQSLGTLSGSNLFHSFKTFSISENQSATFTGDNNISNVISRVTGGEVSTIDGLLRSQIGQADFFFINPSGIVFGPHATVDVPAAFHVSTADSLVFDDGSVFSASPGETSTLTQAAPESFGFLGQQSASIEINGTVLEFKPESTISISAGDIAIQPSEESTPSITSENGVLKIKAIGTKAGTMDFDSGATVASANSEVTNNYSGDLHMNSAEINVSGNGGGTVSIAAGNAEIINSTMESDNKGDLNSTGGIEISLKGSLDVLNGSNISCTTLADQNSGDIAISADSINIDGQGDYAGIYSTTNDGSSGNAGTITITASHGIDVMDGGQIVCDTSGEGGAGKVIINAKNITINDKNNDSFTGIACDANSILSGNAGSIDITLNDSLNLINGAKISTNSWSEGDAGKISISSGSILIDGLGQSTGIYSQANEERSKGSAGTVQITAKDIIEIKSKGRISTDSYSDDDAGSISINAENLKIDGKGYYTGISSDAATENSQASGGSVSIILSGDLEISDSGEISSNTWSLGDAGNVAISANGMIQVLNGALIISSTYSKGNAGDVVVDAGNMIIDKQESDSWTGIASACEPNAEGNGGNVQIYVNDMLNVVNGGQITSSTYSKGDAGNVFVNAGNMIIDDQESSSWTGIASACEPNAEGNGGNVQIYVNDMLNVINGGEITSSTYSKGNAGDVFVNAGNMFIDKQGNEALTGVTSRSTTSSEGNAGTVEISVYDILEIINGAEISTYTYSKGHAGDVIINAGDILIDDQGSYSWTGIASSCENNSEGNSGSIAISAKNLSIDGKGSTSGIFNQAYLGSQGDAGTININVSGLIAMTDHAYIGSDTFSIGKAGNITIKAEKITIDSLSDIQSVADYRSEGPAGSIDITSKQIELSNESEISIGSYQNLADKYFDDDLSNKSKLTIETDILSLDENSMVTSESKVNAPASPIDINAKNIVLKNNSSVNTSAYSAHGGDITIRANNILLHDGLITTSVNDSEGNGNGGDITLKGIQDGDSAHYLVMKHGVIQANTAASNASGGDINLDIKGIIIDKNYKPLSLDNPEREDYENDPLLNAIQAAAPGGRKGDININDAPKLDMSGAVANISTELAENVNLATDLCLMLGSQDASSLIYENKGLHPQWPEEPSSIFLDRRRLEPFVIINE
ncbi:putative Filamentous haemagglutinin family outer membrane protein [Desulfamplus magnetovallimortis]|uniref:Putative Filamentous haemagglutinin family outer membrane protein n=1 Tax=Desulfamplus magnetovallimortis TaxID=1246637 RepID=A0A1W1HHY8_9BACT|nr:filamentous hemagglutinin N-terminal domain-containing protein [Desulfamplus magnetovallimortis]SLM32121.1 putative Filamentous haemagglutinin family outer membrane protein [Desulfamplus magnetovallimortis]